MLERRRLPRGLPLRAGSDADGRGRPERRVRAVLRRFTEPESPILEVGDLRLDREQRHITVRGEPVELSAMAFDLLAFLMTHPGRVFTRLELLEAVRGDTYGSFERAVDSHIKRLRQRIAARKIADPYHNVNLTAWPRTFTDRRPPDEADREKLKRLAAQFRASTTVARRAA